MFYHDGGKLQYEVKVTKPDPVFAKALQQAIGGIQGEIRVCLQYMFQAWGARGPAKYRDMLLHTGTEEMAHIEMLATAVALNLEGAPTDMDEAAKDPIVMAKLGGHERAACHYHLHGGHACRLQWSTVQCQPRLCQRQYRR